MRNFLRTGLILLLVIASMPAVGSNLPWFDIASFYPGRPTSNAIIRVGMPRSVTISAESPAQDCPSCVCLAGIVPAGTVVVSLNRISTAGASTNIGTLTWAGSSRTCTASFVGLLTAFAPGELLEEKFPASPDANFANITITIPAIRAEQ